MSTPSQQPQYAIIGATGHLGHASLDHLLAQGVTPEHVVALVRDVAKAAPWRERGVTVRHVDFDDPATMPTALAGVDRLLLISSPDVGKRERQHRNVLDAAQAAGVSRLVYTSFVGAQTHPENPLTPEHKITEDLLQRSQLPEVVILRNGAYQENDLGHLEHTLASGGLVGASGQGRISAASRDDLAQAAAISLTDAVAPGTYELSGPSVTKADTARQIAEAAQTPVRYRNVSVDEFRAGLEASGMPAPVASMFAQVEQCAAADAMHLESDDLRTILGRAPRTYAETTRALLAG